MQLQVGVVVGGGVLVDGEQDRSTLLDKNGVYVTCG